MPDDLTLTEEELDQLVEAVKASVPHTEPRLRTRNELIAQFPQQSFTTTCPACRQVLVLKDGRRGVFYGCQNFPACRGTINANQETGAPLTPARPPRSSYWGTRAEPSHLASVVTYLDTPPRNDEARVRELVQMAREEKAKRKKGEQKAPPRTKTRFDIIDED